MARAELTVVTPHDVAVSHFALAAALASSVSAESAKVVPAGKGGHEAVLKVTKRCWPKDWVATVTFMGG
jgi:hypothetical protein